MFERSLFMRNHLKRYTDSFLKNEEGMETIEFVVILAVVAGLLFIVFQIVGSVKKKAVEASDEIKTNLDQITFGGNEDTAKN